MIVYVMMRNQITQYELAKVELAINLLEQPNLEKISSKDIELM